MRRFAVRCALLSVPFAIVSIHGVTLRFAIPPYNISPVRLPLGTSLSVEARGPSPLVRLQQFSLRLRVTWPSKYKGVQGENLLGWWRYVDPVMVVDVQAWPLALIWGFYAAKSGRRKLLPFSCASCGYDTRATPGRCPECGGLGMPVTRRRLAASTCGLRLVGMLAALTSVACWPGVARPISMDGYVSPLLFPRVPLWPLGFERPQAGWAGNSYILAVSGTLGTVGWIEAPSGVVYSGTLLLLLRPRYRTGRGRAPRRVR
jgi:hypothetical protein